MRGRQEGERKGHLDDYIGFIGITTKNQMALSPLTRQTTSIHLRTIFYFIGNVCDCNKVFVCLRMFENGFHSKNVWMSDKSWEPGMFWKTFTLATFATFTTFATFATFTLSFTLSRHAEQLLFSCLCSKVTLTLFRFHYFRYFHYFHNFQSLIQSLSTCWTTFVFMFGLKSHCL